MELNLCLITSINASIAPLTISVTIIRKPIEIIRDDERSLFLRNASHPFFGLAFSFQIIFRESCISIKTDVAPITSVMMLAAKAKFVLPEKVMFFDDLLYLRSGRRAQQPMQLIKYSISYCIATVKNTNKRHDQQ